MVIDDRELENQIDQAISALDKKEGGLDNAQFSVAYVVKAIIVDIRRIANALEGYKANTAANATSSVTEET